MVLTLAGAVSEADWGGHWNMPAEPPSVSLREPAPDILCDVHMVHCYEQPTGLFIQREHTIYGLIAHLAQKRFCFFD